MSEPVEGHVRETDAFTLRMERDPLLRSTITAVTVFDRAPDWPRLVDRVERATRLVPTFRARLVRTPLRLAPPRWVLDPDFDLSWHLRRVHAPEPHTLETVVEMARIAGMSAFDPARPLWELTLVGGLEDGQAALLMKVHHALTDGLGGIDLTARIVDGDREPADLGPLPPVPTSEHPVGSPLAEAVGFGARRAGGLAGSAITSVPSAVGRVVRDPVGTARSAAATAASLARFVRPVATTRSPVMTGRRLQWSLRHLDVPTADLKAAGRAAGGSLNDAFLAGVTGGLRRYHAHHDAIVPTLRVTMPISTRRPEDPVGGNRITLARFEVPVAVTDPGARMREIGRRSAGMRAERALAYSEAVAGALNLLPAAVTGGMLKHVDFLASNVPGFPVPVYVGGARLEAFYAFGPTIGAAANITLMSYRDTCHLGITTDNGAVPDPDLLHTSLVEGFAEVLASARRSTPARPRAHSTARVARPGTG
jgi:diacylglycerol O-acyltransferase / wax synthase